MDLARLIADERWDALDDYIKGLPANSRLNEAMLNDEEYAMMLASADESTETWSPRVTQWTLTTSMLSQLLSAVAGVQSAIIASAGGHPKQHKPFPAPITKLDEARAQLDREASAVILRMAGFDPSQYL